MTASKHKRTLDRIVWRSRLKAALRIGGILLMLLGGMFLPACRGELGPKSTMFNRIAYPGTFAEPGLITLVIGAVAVALSWLIRGDDLLD